MLKHFILFLSVFLFITTLEKAVAQDKEVTSNNVTYSISEWGINGSFSFVPEVFRNPITNKDEGKITFISNERDTTVITAGVIESFINKMKSSNLPLSENSSSEKVHSEQIKSDYLSSLQNIKNFLLDPQKVENFIIKLKEFKNKGSNSNWNYVLNTIRNLSLHVNGAFE